MREREEFDPLGSVSSVVKICRLREAATIPNWPRQIKMLFGAATLPMVIVYWQNGYRNK
jgi:hypothetical protein